MDLRQFFRKLRETEAAIADEFPIVISLETPDGGKAGVASEVSRLNAAKMIVEGRAMLADEAAKAQFKEKQLSAREALEKADLARRLQVAIVDQTALAQIRDRKLSTPSK